MCIQSNDAHFDPREDGLIHSQLFEETLLALLLVSDLHTLILPVLMRVLHRIQEGQGY